MTQEPNDRTAPLDAEARRIEEQELLRVLSEEPQDAAEGAIRARLPQFLLRLRLLLECFGGILFGINMAVIAIVCNFILFNYLLHMEF